MYKFAHDILHGDHIRNRCGRISRVGRVEEDSEKKYHYDRADTAECDQTKTIAGAVFIAPGCRETDTDCHDKRHRHGTCGHTAGVKSHRQEVP